MKYDCCLREWDFSVTWVCHELKTSCRVRFFGFTCTHYYHVTCGNTYIIITSQMVIISTNAPQAQRMHTVTRGGAKNQQPSESGEGGPSWV